MGFHRSHAGLGRFHLPHLPRMSWQTTKHLLNPWGINPKKRGRLQRLSKRWLSCSFSNLVLGDSKKTCLKVSFIFNVAKQLRKTVSWIAKLWLLQPAFVGQAPHLWENPQSESEQNSGLASCLVVFLYDNKTQPQQPQQTHAQHTTVTTTITVTHPTDSCLITDHWSFTVFQPAVSERAWHIHALFQSPSPETGVSSSRQQVDQQKVSKYICNASRDGSNCGTPKGTTDLGIKFWANQVLALNWEDGAFSTSSSSWVCMSMISSFGTCHRRVGMREFQLLRMTTWSNQLVPVGIVTSAFWPYFSELISWMRFISIAGWWRYSCSCGMVPREGWMETWTKNCCKSIFGRENCNIYIGFKCNILQVMIGPQISLMAFSKAEGS